MLNNGPVTQKLKLPLEMRYMLQVNLLADDILRTFNIIDVLLS